MPGRFSRFSVKGITAKYVGRTPPNATQISTQMDKEARTKKSRAHMARIATEWEEKTKRDRKRKGQRTRLERQERRRERKKESNEALGNISTLFEPKKQRKRTKKPKPPKPPTTPTASQPSEKVNQGVGSAIAEIRDQSSIAATIASQPASPGPAEPKAKTKEPSIEIVTKRRNSVKNANRKTQLKRYDYARVRKYKAAQSKEYRKLTEKIRKKEYEQQHGKTESALGSILPTGLLRNLMPTRLTNWLSGASKKPSKLDKLRVEAERMRTELEEIEKVESHLGQELGNAIRTSRTAEAASRNARKQYRRTLKQKPKNEEEKNKTEEAIKKEEPTNSSNI